MEHHPNKVECYRRTLAQISLFLLLFCFSSLRALAAPENSAKKLISLTQENLYTESCRNTALYVNNQNLYSEPEAAYFVAVCLQQEPATPKALREAIKLLEYSQSKGFADAALQLSLSYSNGYGVSVNFLIATDWQRAFDRLSKPARQPTMVITAKSAKSITTTDLLRNLEKKALTGDPEAEYLLAKSYEKGEWSQVDMKKSMHWYSISAKGGNGHANFMMGYFYCRGIGVEKDTRKANYHFQLSDKISICK